MSTLSAVGSWSPSSRLASTVKGENAPAVLSALPALTRGLKGGGDPGQGEPLGPLEIEIELVETWSSGGPGPRARTESPRDRCRTFRRREDSTLGAEEVEIDLLDRRLREVGEGGHHLTGVGIEVDRAFQFHVGGEAVGGDEDAVRLAGQRLADVDAALDRAGQGRAVDRWRCRSWRTRGSAPRPRCRRRVRRRRRRPCRWRRWAPARTLPGRVIVALRISDGDGAVGLCVCGTLRSTSSPDMLCPRLPSSASPSGSG